MNYFSILLFVLVYFFKVKLAECQHDVKDGALGFRDKYYLRSFKITSPLKNIKDELFDEDPQHVLRILYFYTTWCPACKSQKVELEKLMNAYGSKIGLKKIDCDTEVEMAKKYHITSLPTIMIFKNNKMLHKSEGLIRAEELTKLVKNNL